MSLLCFDFIDTNLMNDLCTICVGEESSASLSLCVDSVLPQCQVISPGLQVLQGHRSKASTCPVPQGGQGTHPHLGTELRAGPAPETQGQPCSRGFSWECRCSQLTLVLLPDFQHRFVLILELLGTG